MSAPPSQFLVPPGSAKIWSTAVAAILFAVQVLLLVAAPAAGAQQMVVSSLEQLHSLMATNARAIVSFRIQGVVCAAPNARGDLALQDDSTVLLLQLPPLNKLVKVGDNIILEGSRCTLTRSEFAIQVGTAPVVDDDGVHSLHGAVRKSGMVHLDAGLTPLRVEWFNNSDQPNLQIEYDGPGVTRAKIPASALWHRDNQATDGQPSFKPGLEYTDYVGNGWNALPDFRSATRVQSGVASGIDIGARSQRTNCALVFTGYLQVSNAGIYNFHVASADGCRLFVGDAQARCKISDAADSHRTIQVNSLSETISEDGNQHWSKLAGRVSTVRMLPGLAELEISLGQRHVTAVVLDPRSYDVTNLAGTFVEATGIYQRTWTGGGQWPARLVVPGTEQVRILSATNTAASNGTLTSIGQIRALSWDQVRKGVPVRIRGIITVANYFSCVLQDASGGIYLPFNITNWVNQPRAGDIWEFEGVTDEGEFSPVVIPTNGVFLGYASLPPGIRPTWSEFQDASLDATMVDIEAAVIEVSDAAITLLTRDGAVTLLGHNRRPLPVGPDGTTASLLGTVVRLRGVYTSPSKGLAKPRVFLLGNVSVSIIELAPEDPFAGAAMPIRDLLLFKSPAAAWGRVKVGGVVLHSEPKECVLADESGSIRINTRKPHPIEEGDWLEAVGFPQVGGPSPVLLEAVTQKKGVKPRPEPVALAPATLLDPSQDARLVRVEALLLSDSVQQTERVLELHAGQVSFLAKLPLQSGGTSTLRLGSLVQLTGVYSSLQGRQSGDGLRAFDLLLDRPEDIVVLRMGPWWTTQRTVTLAVILAIGLALALAWATLLRRTVARRSLQLKLEIENRQLIEQQRLVEQERSRVAQDLHDELGARLAEVGILGALANNPDVSHEKQRGYLNRLAELGRVLVSGLDEIVWAVNPKHDSNKAVSGYLCDYAQDFLQSADITCRIDIVQPWPDRVFTSRDRHHLFLAFREALTNVVKHAHASEVCVRIGRDPQSLWVAVEDNGKGVKPDQPKGDGLINMSNRMKQIGGECEVKARPGGGTTVTFRVFHDQNSPTA